MPQSLTLDRGSTIHRLMWSQINDIIHFKSYIYDISTLLYDFEHVLMMHAMTYDEFHRHLGKAGLTLRQFAGLVKMNRVSISNYSKAGEVPSHLAVIAALMGEMAEQHIDFRIVLTGIEIEPKKPRGAAAKGRFGGDKQRSLQLLETSNK